MGIRYLNHAAVLKCVHGGTVQLMPPPRRSMHVEGSPVLTDRDLLAAVIIGCPQVGPGLKPCTRVVTILTGRSIKIKIDSQTPLLSTLRGMTDGVAPGMVTAFTTGQSNAETEGGAAETATRDAAPEPELSWWQRLLQSELVQGALGLVYGMVQGFTPFGFLLPSPAPHVRAFEFFRGAGEIIAGITEIVVGIGGEGVGIALDATGVGAIVGVPINVASAAVIAHGVAVVGAGAVTISNATSMSDSGSSPGPESSGGGPATPPAAPASPDVSARPPGVPPDWVSKPSKGPGGTRYIDPANPHNSVRVMPGDPKSPYPNSQKPYVRWQRNGQSLDKNGNPVERDTPEAHIPLEDFVYRP